jgi:diguanylate cyclase (GGDEF)-like protein/PAS domain S-box-containing protein
MKILLIEDNAGDVGLLRLILAETETPVDLIHSENLAGALERLQRERFDVILLDLWLPDGYGTAAFAKIYGTAPSVPIVVLTGLDDEALADQLVSAGAQDYLVKGYADAKLLMRSIRYAIERKKAQEKLMLAAQVFESTLEGIIITDGDARILSVNKAFTAITGYAQEEVVGQNPRLFGSERHDATFFEQMWAALASSGQWQGEIWNRRKDGEIFPAWMNVSAVGAANGTTSHYVAVFTEITNLKLSEERLHYLAHYDALTGLPNRVLLHDRLNHAMARARRTDKLMAVMFLDLDRFKIINDTLGHHVADELLRAMAERLKSCVRESDTVARLSGDEFSIILENLAHREDAELVSQKILQALSSAFQLENHEIFVTASIGIAIYPGAHCDEEKLLENADVAMYYAKDHGRNNYQFYTASMNARSLERLKLETDLRHALDREEFVLYYQPQFDVNLGRIVGVEALIRWQHPERKLIAPVEFVPLLEETGLIVPVGEWVLRTACRQCKTWQDEGHADLRMAVNLSARQFKQPNLAETIAQILAETGLDSTFLELELTESIVMENSEETIRTLQRFKSMGIKIALDDFGTGASSLAYLKHFPIDTLKVCHSFVINIAHDEKDAAIAAAVIALANNMNLNSVAEGVETCEQLEFLKFQQCHEMQGYLFSKPLPAEALTNLLREKEGDGMGHG